MAHGMMSYMSTILLGIAVGVPALAVLLLRVNAAIVFLTLCAGMVLLHFVGDNAILAADAMVPGADPATAAQLALLLGPALATVILLRRTMSSGKLLLNILPAIGMGASAILLVAPYLPQGMAQALAEGTTWQSYKSYQELIIGITCLVSLGTLWGMSRKKGEAKGGKKGH